MKKLIALLLAASSLAMSTSALAAEYNSFDVYAIGSAVSSEHKGVSRNYTTSSSSGNVTMNGVTTSGLNYGSPVFRSTSFSSEYLPTYRSGDLLTFALMAKNSGTAVKVNAGDILTFICSKQDSTNYDNYTVQCIDQVTLTPSDSTSYIYCTFKLRDSLQDGRYKLEMRLNGISNTYAFLIGTPSVELLYAKAPESRTGDKADKYILKEGNAYCFGKATITGGANFSQTGTEFGFIFDGDQNKKYTKGTIRSGNNLTADAQAVANSSNANENSEIGGTGNYFFRMVIEGVTDASQLPDVDVYLNE